MESVMYFIFFAGILLLAVDDARRQSVPAAISDTWTIALALCSLFSNRGNFLVGICFLVAGSLFAYCTGGMGSADVLVLAASAWTFGGLLTLFALLLACLSGIIYGLCTRTKRLAFIPHLLVGTLLALFLNLVLPLA